MTSDEIDRMLSSDDEIEPASGFVTSVMAAARDQAARPRPRAFPWLRVMAGSVGCLAAAASGTVLVLSLAPALDTQALSWAANSAAPAIGCAVVTVLASFALVSLRRLRSVV